MNIEDVALKLLAAHITSEGVPYDEAHEGAENKVIQKCFALAGKFMAYSTLDEGGAGKAVEDALYNPGDPGGLAGNLRSALEVFGLTLPYRVAETPQGPPVESPIVVIANQSLEISRLKAQAKEDIHVMGEISKARDTAFAQVDKLRKTLEYMANPSSALNDVFECRAYARAAAKNVW